MSDPDPLIAEIFAIRQAIERLIDGMDEIKVQIDAWRFDQRLSQVEADLEQIRQRLDGDG